MEQDAGRAAEGSEEQASSRWPVSAATGLLEAHVWQEGRGPDTPSVDFKGQKYAVLAGTHYKDYELFQAGNLLLWVDLGDRKEVVSTRLFEEGFHYEVKEIHHPEVPPHSLLENVVGLFGLLQEFASEFIPLSTGKLEQALPASTEKGKKKEE